MTTIQIARLFHAHRAGSYKGRPAYQAKCTCHIDRMPSLSITEPEKGRTRVHCHASCNDLEVLASKGLTVSDLYTEKRSMTPEIRRRLEAEDRLALKQRQHGLAIMAQAVLPEERRYWAAVERNLAVEIHRLRSILEPSKEAKREQQRTSQHIIREYGFDVLWECVPVARIQARLMHERSSNDKF